MQLTGNLLKLLQSNEDEKTVQVLQKYYLAAYPVMLQSNRIDDFLATISRTCSALQDNNAPLILKEAKGVVKKVITDGVITDRYYRSLIYRWRTCNLAGSPSVIYWL